MGGIVVRSIADVVFPARHIWVTDLDSVLVKQLCDEKGTNDAGDIANLVEEADVTFCAVPPAAVPRHSTTGCTLLISTPMAHQHRSRCHDDNT